MWFHDVGNENKQKKNRWKNPYYSEFRKVNEHLACNRIRFRILFSSPVLFVVAILFFNFFEPSILIRGDFYVLMWGAYEIITSTLSNLHI